MKTVLFIISGIYFNGGTTFLLRLSRRLARDGVSVKVLTLTTRGDPGLRMQLSRTAELFTLRDVSRFTWVFPEIIHYLRVFIPFERRKTERVIGNIDHIHCFGFWALVAGHALKSSGFITSSPPLSIGVYQQYEYFHSENQKNPVYRYLKSLICQKGFHNNILFFNEANKRTYARWFECDGVSGATVLPIGVDISEFRYSPDRPVNRERLVSVGNLVQFKTYNENVIKSLPILHKAGFRFAYDIYGDGPTRKSLERLVTKLGLEHHVQFHGPVPYSELQEAIRDAFMFIGSGTAVIEASACGIPALVGIESEGEAISYGCLHEIPGFSYNEKGLALPTCRYVDKVADLAGLTTDDYCAQCELARKRAEAFSLSKLVDGFFEFHKQCSTSLELTFDTRLRSRLFGAVAVIMLKHALRLDTTFRNRRQPNASE